MGLKNGDIIKCKKSSKYFGLIKNYEYYVVHVWKDDTIIKKILLSEFKKYWFNYNKYHEYFYTKKERTNLLRKMKLETLCKLD
jgi:hypothetical protein